MLPRRARAPLGSMWNVPAVRHCRAPASSSRAGCLVRPASTGLLPPDEALSHRSAHSARSAASAERAREEVLQLRGELSERRGEVQQLQQHVRQLERSLQARAGQMQRVVEELHSLPGSALARPTSTDEAGQSDRRMAELIDQIMNLHSDAYEMVEARDHEQQDLLRERLAETHMESQRLIVRSLDSGACAIGSRGCERSLSRRKQSLRGTLESREARRGSRKHEDLLKAYDCTDADIHRRMQRMARELEEERQARREQESVTQRLAAALHEARLRQPPSQVEPSFDVTLPRGGGSGVRALRLELQAVRSEEEAQRAASRRHADIEARAEEAQLLREVLSELEWRCAELEADRAAAERRADDSEALAGQARRAEAELWAEARAARRRAQLLAEVANEVAWQADWRQVQALQGELGAQGELRAAEHRCSELEAFASEVAAHPL